MNKDITALIRENIKALVPYSSARSEFKGTSGIFLDANENPYGENNRYPDPFQVALKEKLAREKGIRPGQLFLNNGSDGIVDMTYRVFCEPHQDKALCFPPTFGMYTVAAALNNIELLKLPLDDDFLIIREELEAHITDENLKVIFLCSPNNPTGNHMRKEDIDYVLEHFNGIVVLDEAYIDFSDRESYIQKLDQYPHLVVLQTMSKSWALAGARVGMAMMSEDLLPYYNKVKTPYNIPSISQKAALKALDNPQVFNKNLHLILDEKEKVKKRLRNSSIVQKIYPSDTNFFLVEFDDAEQRYQQLVERQVIVRNQNHIIKNCMRITVGSPEENKKLFKALMEIEQEKTS